MSVAASFGLTAVSLLRTAPLNPKMFPIVACFFTHIVQEELPIFPNIQMLVMLRYPGSWWWIQLSVPLLNKR